jgi:gliding motility-associated-like protein
MTRFLLTTALLTISCLGLQAQAIILASSTSGCDSVAVSFSLSPANVSDTVTSIAWSFGNGETRNSGTAHTVAYTLPGTYVVSALINGTTTLTLAGGISVWPAPDARFGYNDSLALGSFSYVFMNVPQETNAVTYSYLWRFSPTDSATTRRTIYTFPEAGDYRVALIVRNNHNCADTVVRQVQVRDVLEVPTVFTPNNDGFNDHFTVRTNGVNKYQLSVYTRSGSLVFRTEAPVISWDGRSLSGYELQPGIYYYVIRQTDGDPLNERTGFVHLFR